MGMRLVSGPLSREACRYAKAKQRAEMKRTIHLLESLNKRQTQGSSDEPPPDSNSVSLQETSSR